MNSIIENLLNTQVRLEATASMQYLAMASWADAKGYNGVAEFFYAQSEEERLHMTKLVKFINERSGNVIVPHLDKPKEDYVSLNELFETFLNSEMYELKKSTKLFLSALNIKIITFIILCNGM